MAKKTKDVEVSLVEENESQVEVNAEGTTQEETTQEAPNETSDENPAEEKITPVVEESLRINEERKVVEIHTLEKIDCTIGFVHYIFDAERTVKVPIDVAAILCSAKKAYRR